MTANLTTHYLDSDTPHIRLIILLKRSLIGALLLLAVFARAVSADEPLTFAVIGDTGSGTKRQFEVARQMKIQWDKTNFGFVIMLGDNIYPDGNPALIKPRFEEPYKELLKAGVKFYAALGNHDVKKGREEEENYDHFNMQGDPYYSFEKGQDLLGKITGSRALVAFFVLDTTNMTSQQAAWLEDKLKSSQARWKVVYMHHPLYSSAHTHGSNMKLRALLEPILVRYMVDVVFAGHDHVYMRTKLQKGIVHFVAGAGGNLRRGDLDRKSPFFAAGNDQVDSFLLVHVTEAEMRFEAIGSNGMVLDSSFIVKPKD